MDRPAHPTRLPLGRTIVVSGLVVALLAVAARVQAVDGVSVAGEDSSSSSAGQAPGRPAVNGPGPRPLAAEAQEAIERLATTSRRINGAGHAHTGGGHLFGPVEEDQPDLCPVGGPDLSSCTPDEG